MESAFSVPVESLGLDGTGSMGLEQHLFSVFIGHSELLGRRWVVRARDIEDATGKVVSHCRGDLERLEQLSKDGNVAFDLRFVEASRDVVEL